MWVSFGQSSGPIENFTLATLAQKGSLFATRPTLFSYIATPEELRASAEALFHVVQSNKVRININQTYPLSDVAQAHSGSGKQKNEWNYAADSLEDSKMDRASGRNEGIVSSSDAPSTGALLSVRKLTKFFGSFAACNGIDLDVQPGEIHALLGENGAGKSTLVKMLFGVLEPTEGEILWKGAPCRHRLPRRGAPQLGIGMVFQHFSLFEALTVAENIALSLDDNISINRISDEATALSQPTACRSIRRRMSPIFRSASASASRSSGRCCRSRS